MFLFFFQVGAVFMSSVLPHSPKINVCPKSLPRRRSYVAIVCYGLFVSFPRKRNLFNSVADPGNFCADLDPGPRIHTSDYNGSRSSFCDLQDVNKFFLLITF
jgi:hypothetical protein